MPCISQATTLSTPFEVDIPAYSAAGWFAVEIWITKLEAYLASNTLADAQALLNEHDIKAVAASGQGGLLLSKGLERQAHWDLFQARLGTLAELKIPRLVVAADFGTEVAPDDYGRAIESLAQAAELAAGAGVTIALEFQRSSRLCASLDTAVALVSQAGAANLGVCLDLFHYYTGPSKFEDLGYLTPQNLAWVQLCDLVGVPREIAGDSDRVLPGDGEFQIAPILDHLATIGYEGYLSLEVLNPQLWAVAVERVADAGRQALERLIPTPPTPERDSSWGVS